MADIQSQGSSALQAYFKYWCSGLHECHCELTKELIFNSFFIPKQLHYQLFEPTSTAN